jgi:hypothetical protein
MLKILLAFLTTALLFGEAAASGENLLKKGGFEETDADNRTQPAHWQVTPGHGSAIEIKPEHYSGKFGGMIVGDGKLHSWSQQVAVPEGNEWTLRLAVRGHEVVMEDSDFAHVSGRIVLESADQFRIQFPKGSFDWELPAIEATVPKGAKVERIKIEVAGKFKFGQIHFDNVSLTERDPLNSPSGYLAKKIEDLEQGLKKIGSVDDSVSVALAELAAAKSALDGDSPNLSQARSHWEAGAKAVSHKAWATLYPDAMSNKPVEAQMIYHGLDATRGWTRLNWPAPTAFTCHLAHGCT